MKDKNVNSKSFYFEDEKGKQYESTDLQHIITQIFIDRVSRNLKPLSYLETLVLDFTYNKLISSEVNKDWENEWEYYDFTDSEARTVKDWWSGIKAVIKTKTREYTGRDAFVSKDIAEERAKICLGCPENREELELLSDGQKVTYTKQDKASSWMRESKGDRNTSYDDQLFLCRLCKGCDLEGKIWYRDDILNDVTQDKEIRVRLQTTLKNKDTGQPFKCWVGKALKDE